MAATTHNTQSMRNTVLTILVIAMVIVGLVVVFSIIGLPSNAVSRSKNLITYKIEGSAEKAVVTYTRADGRISEPQPIDMPWYLNISNMKAGGLVVLTAAAIEKGTIKCTILDGNTIVDTNIKAPFIDKALCGGYIK